jgi:uncharacterized protein (TIGR03437 family)
LWYLAATVKQALQAALILLLAVWPAAAGQEPDALPCGTGPATEAQVEELHRWVLAREAQRLVPMAQTRPHAIRVVNGVYLLETDSTNAPFDRPFDLQNRSLLFTRNPDDTFTVAKQALNYDSSPGTLYYTFPSSGSTADAHYRAYTLTAFSFPFLGQNISRVYLSTYRGIFLSPPAISEVTTVGTVYEYDAADLFSLGGVITPLLHTTRGQRSRYLFVKENSDSLLITWRSAQNGDDLTNELGTDIQARLYPNGNILFSYKRAPVFGDIALSSGQEARRQSASQSATLTDATGDVSGTTADPALRDLLDIQSVRAARAAGTDLLEFQVTVKGTLTAAASLPTNDITYALTLTDTVTRAARSFSLAINRGGYQWLSIPNRPSAVIEEHGFTVRVMESAVPLASASISVRLASSYSGASDSVTGTVNLGAHTADLETAFSSLPGPAVLSGPLFGTYTLPAVDVVRVWQQIREAYGLKDGDLDGIAIFQSFYTNMIISGASAYSTGGRASANGVFPASYLNRPKSTNVTQMNRISSTNDNGHTLIHEFSHYWLYNLRIMENGVSSRVLNPATAHPAQYVHMPAAFPVLSTGDSSVMGGTRFRDNGDGSFTAPSPYPYYGLTWHELYLMGLAAPQEVEPWFYIDNSNPALGPEYYTPAGTYRGTRKNVVIQQVIDALGPRVPAYKDSQKSFKVMFVLMERSTRRATDDEIGQVNTKRQQMERNFALATGNRAQLTATLGLGEPLRPAFTANGVVNGASFAAPLAAGMIASLFGTGLASTTAPASGTPLPTTLAGASLQMEGFSAPLFFVSPAQINFQVPWEVQGRTSAGLTLTAGGTSVTATVSISSTAPAIFSTNSTGRGQGAILTSTQEIAAARGAISGRTTRPARRGEYISIYCLGLGLVSNTPRTGLAAGANPLSQAVTQPGVSIGGVQATVTFAGLAPSFVGLYQVNARIPDGAPTGDAVSVVLSIGGTTSNTVTIAIE